MLHAAALAAVVAPKMELGVVMNVDLTSEATFKRHFQIAEGWASYVRVSIGTDQQAWRPELERLTYERSRRLAIECRQRGWGMDVTFGGVPVTDEWNVLGKPARKMLGKRYAEMPRSWWPRWAEFQKRSAKAIVDAYGPDAPKKIRFQTFNEPYSRGEDDLVDELLVYLIPRVVGRDGTVFGCALDGPTIWGHYGQIHDQMERFATLLANNPAIDKIIRKVPVSMYPTPDQAGLYDPQLLVQQYLELASKVVRTGREVLERPVYFAEAGVGRVYDVLPSIYGARTNEVAEDALIASLEGFRRLGFQHVTVYQSKDHDERDAKTYGYGLADRFGRLRVDVTRLVRLAKGESLAVND